MSLKTKLGNSIGRSFVVYILLFSSFVALISTSVQLFVEYKRDISAIENTAKQIENSHKTTISQALWTYDALILESQLKGINTLPGVVYACIKKHNQILKEIGNNSPGQKVLSYQYAMAHKAKHKELYLGTLEVKISLSDVYDHLKERVVLILITQTLKTFLVSVFILVLFYLIVGRHLNAMANFAKSIHLNNLEDKFKLNRKGGANKKSDELGAVESALNSMREKLVDEIKNVQLTQEALKESEERFKLAMDSNKDGLWDWNIKTNIVFYSQGWASILSEDTVDSTYDFWESRIHPNDKEMVLFSLQEHLDNPLNQWEKEHRVKTKSGDWKWVLGRGAVVKQDNEGKPARMVGTMTDISERKRTEMKLQQSEKRSESILQASPNPVVVYDANGLPQFINESFTNVFGWSLEEIQGGTIPFVPDEEKEITLAKINEIYRFGKPLQFLTKRLTKSNDILDININAAVYKDFEGKSSGLVVNLTDITEQIRLEGQYRQAQKMESIGRLAGGVAHDFNNMLSVILGNAEILGEDLHSSHPSIRSLIEIQKAAERSANLTRQLLAFARKQTIVPKIIDLNETIEGMLKMIKRLIGEDIKLSWQPKASLWSVKIDPSQIDQILANLCVNARDSIEGIGKIAIETDHIHFTKEYCGENAGFIPGDFVVMTVSDTGYGMNKKTLDNLFEPFFTTKELGEGTGLGLSTVYGIVKQNNGFINVYSELERGSVFKIYLPKHSKDAINKNRESSKTYNYSGNETILLVEDEKAILEMTSTMLERMGHRVLAASKPSEAVKISRKHNKEGIHLLMTDVVMPEMNGKDLAIQISTTYPDIKCLYMSGYTANVIAHHGILDDGLNFLNKPFSRQDLIVKLREIFDKKPT